MNWSTWRFPTQQEATPEKGEEKLERPRALGDQHFPLLDAHSRAELSDGAELALRAPGEERHPLEEIDLLLGDPMLSDVISSFQFELLENTRGSYPPTRPRVYRRGRDTYRVYDGIDRLGTWEQVGGRGQMLYHCALLLDTIRGL